MFKHANTRKHVYEYSRSFVRVFLRILAHLAHPAHFLSIWSNYLFSFGNGMNLSKKQCQICFCGPTEKDTEGGGRGFSLSKNNARFAFAVP